MALIAGVDGCKAGWIAATALSDELSHPSIRVVARLEDLLDGPDMPALVAIDMPIGLPDHIDGAGRGPEQAVRPFLGARKGSVFSIPARAAVEAEPGPYRGSEDRLAAFRRAVAVARKHSLPSGGFSIQAFGIFPKILEVDAILRLRPDWRERIREVHPELAFRLMKGAPLDHAKKTPDGKAERRSLLMAEGISGQALEARPPRGASEDDLLDAMAGLVAACHIQAGRGVPYPDPPLHDAYGIPVAIWGWRAEPSSD